ncbi:MAG: glycerol kinase GlpK [Pseudomonadota bacterium]
MPDRILSIDQGTTSSRAMLFDSHGQPAGVAQKEFPQYFPADGWVEHDPDDIWRDTVQVIKGALDNGKRSAGDVAAIGITNQRETTLVWDRKTGEPIHRAIVWQDRRTAKLCQDLKNDGQEDLVRDRSGLLLDPYFSATKLAWLLDNVEGARAKADKGDLAFGTIDTFLLWHLTGGQVHATDASNAARTLLFNIHKQDWDEDLLALFNVPRSVLPQVLDCQADFGATPKSLFGAPLPIRGIAGDQQAATIGQACFQPGMMKSTYGTGCFALFNTGKTAVTSRNRLLTTVAYRLGGQVTYALEGSIFIAGAAVQWLRDGLKVLHNAAETADLAAAADPAQQVYLVPAFTGLGAPYWRADARGAIFGLTRASGPAEMAKATLDSVCYQTRDLLEAMRSDGASDLATLRVDGGMVANDWFLQRLADILGVAVERPVVPETTALGAAYLAGLAEGFFSAQPGGGDGIDRGLAALGATWRSDGRFEPKMNPDDRDIGYKGWQNAVQQCLNFAAEQKK